MHVLILSAVRVQCELASLELSAIITNVQSQCTLPHHTTHTLLTQVKRRRGKTAQMEEDQLEGEWAYEGYFDIPYLIVQATGTTMRIIMTALTTAHKWKRYLDSLQKWHLQVAL